MALHGQHLGRENFGMTSDSTEIIAVPSVTNINLLAICVLPIVLGCLSFPLHAAVVGAVIWNESGSPSELWVCSHRHYLCKFSLDAVAHTHG